MGATCSNCSTVNLDTQQSIDVMDSFRNKDKFERPIDSLRAIKHIRKQEK